MRYRFVILKAILIVLAGALVGCIEGDHEASDQVSDSDQVSVVALTGYLKDSAVSGVTYQTPTHEGVTGSDGSFVYREGEIVRFTIGDTLLGKLTGRAEVTPFDLAGSDIHIGVAINKALLDEYDSSFQAVVNIAVLLQSLDRDADPKNGIEISPNVAALLNGVKLDLYKNWSAFQRDAALLHVLTEATILGLLDKSHLVTKPDSALQHLYATIGVNPYNVRKIGEERTEWHSDGSHNDPGKHWIFTFNHTLDAFQVVSEDGTLLGEAEFQFDANGNLIEQLVDSDGNGATDYKLGYSYNSQSDLTYEERDDNLDGEPELAKTWEYQYDKHNKLIHQTERDSVGIWLTLNEYDYDNKGNMTFHKWLCNEAAHEGACYEYVGWEGEIWRIPDQLTIYEYDDSGNKILESTDVGADGVSNDITSYEYDAQGNLRREISGGIVISEYDARGNLTRWATDYGDDGNVDSYGINNYNENDDVVLEEAYWDDDGIPDETSSFTHLYDDNGNRTRTEEDIGNNGSIDLVKTWHYNADNKLIRVEKDEPADGIPEHVETFDYDATGNLVRHVQAIPTNLPPSERTWVYEYGSSGYLISESEINDLGGDGELQFPDTVSTINYEAGNWRNVFETAPEPFPESFELKPPIKNTVTVDGKEWLQPAYFTGYTFDQVNAVCPAGACVGSLPGSTFDLTGYTWASIGEVSGLFNAYGVDPPFTGPHQRRKDDPNVDASIAQDFTITTLACFGDCPVDFYFVAGTVRDPAPVGALRYTPYFLYTDHALPPGPQDLVFDNTDFNFFGAVLALEEVGVWLWRPVE